LEYRAIAAIGDELMGVLGDSGIQIVLDHHHDRRGMPTSGGIFFYRSGVHRVCRAESIHINAAVGLKLVQELLGQVLVPFLRKVTQRIFHSEPFFWRAKYVFAFWSVANRCIVCGLRWQLGRNSL